MEKEIQKKVVLSSKVDLKKDIGRIDLPFKTISSWCPDDNNPFIIYLNSLNGPTDNSPRLRNALTAQMRFNSPLSFSAVRVDRGASAYYTYDPMNRRIIIEWGKIDPKGEAKLHDYLRQAVDYSARLREGAKLCSGHLAKVSGTKTTYVALLEALDEKNTPKLTRDEPLGIMVNTLISHKYIPVDNSGHVCLPIFRK